MHHISSPDSSPPEIDPKDFRCVSIFMLGMSEDEKDIVEFNFVEDEPPLKCFDNTLYVDRKHNPPYVLLNNTESRIWQISSGIPECREKKIEGTEVTIFAGTY